MTLRVITMVEDADGNVSQALTRTYDTEEVSGTVGVNVNIQFDKEINQVDHIGTTPRDRK